MVELVERSVLLIRGRRRILGHLGKENRTQRLCNQLITYIYFVLFLVGENNADIVPDESMTGSPVSFKGLDDKFMCYFYDGN